MAYLTSRHFGLAAYPSIFGLIMGLFGLAYGIAPLIAAHVRDVARSYVPLFGAFSVALGVAAIFVLLLGRPPVLAAHEP